MTKPSDTRWLSRERAVPAVRESLPALVTTFEEIYNESGDAESHGIASLLVKYKTVASIYMLCDVLHTVAKLQGLLQGKSVDIASVPAMVNVTITRLKEIKDNSDTSTWFKDHMNVFSSNSILGSRNIVITSEEKSSFIQQVYKPYIQSVIDHINTRVASTDFISSMSVFDPRNLPKTEEELSHYGMDKIDMLASFYGSTQKVTLNGQEAVSQQDIHPEETVSEWKLFRRIIYMQYCEKSLQDVLLLLTGKDDIRAGFPNLSRLAEILEVLPVTTATVERSFSSMKLIKTRLRSRMGEDTLEHTMRICIEGPTHLSEQMLDEIIVQYKNIKRRKIAL